MNETKITAIYQRTSACRSARGNRCHMKRELRGVRAPGRSAARSPETLRGAPNLTYIFTKKTFTSLSAEVRTRFNAFE